jgi:hypothetical protein
VSSRKVKPQTKPQTTKPIACSERLSYNPPHSPIGLGALHSLVVRQLWELDVGGSNPSAPTIFQAVSGSYMSKKPNKNGGFSVSGLSAPFFCNILKHADLQGAITQTNTQTNTNAGSQ